MNIFARSVTMIVMTAAITLFTAIANSAPNYAALANLPDFSGYWLSPPPDLSALPQGKGGAPFEPGPLGPGAPRAPLNAVAQARHDQVDAPGEDPGHYERYCQPFRFVGDNGFMTGFEILFTPGRVTLTNELGLIRRIYTDGRLLPTDGIESLDGSSVGHWEGKTLVVETVDLDHTAAYPRELDAGASPLGSGARISERFSLKDKNTLQIEMTLTAPELLTAPYKATQLFKRDKHYAPIQRTACVKNDRLIDPVTGKQRFDLTPPADIPPPPQ